MMLSPPTIATAILLLIAGYYDYRDRRLPGPGGWPIPLLIVTTGIINTVIYGMGPITIFLFVNLLIGISYIIFYHFRIAAAGDTKIFLAMILGFPFSPTTFLMYLLGLIPGAYMIIRKVRPIPLITCLAIGYLLTVLALALA